MLPLCHVLNREVFLVHGGLFSVDNVTLADLQKESRLGEPPDQGRIVEMLWSDPCPTKGRMPSRRGVGVNFGPDVTENFLKTNDLSLVVRSHEMKDDGYEVRIVFFVFFRCSWDFSLYRKILSNFISSI